jgi:hypothetical protein
MLPPSEPTIKKFLFIFDWFIVKPLTGIISPYFLLNIRKPLMGYFSNILDFICDPSSVIAWLSTYHNNILPSVAKERIL